MKLDHIDFGTDIVIMGFIMFFQKAASSLGEHFCKYVMTRCVTHETWFIAGYLWVTSLAYRRRQTYIQTDKNILFILKRQELTFFPPPTAFLDLTFCPPFDLMTWLFSALSFCDLTFFPPSRFVTWLFFRPLILATWLFFRPVVLGLDFFSALSF